ncbi:MAG TPA: phosphoribosylamine--glycine ligase [Dehalococcoidia bacterium]|nr:phosphoribosylamine--glycine ligase [Dehalococcoidia bacterium]
MPTNVLVIGAGAREHAIAWKLRQSPSLGSLYIAPGNAGSAQAAEALPLAIPTPHAPDEKVRAFGDAVVAMAREHAIDLVVVAPDDPLALGLVDMLDAAGIRAFGPTKAAARIEASKSFAKELMRRHGIPMSVSARFDDYESARTYVASRPGNVVVKADGLAAGKGSIVTQSHDEAFAALRELMLERAFGASGTTVVIEDMLTGREVSAHAFSDGEHVVHMPFSCDHKAVYDGGEGPNTGGMGAYSPPSWLDDATAETIRRDVTEAAVRAMAAEGAPFRGVLFPGLFVTDDGPRVIEFNSRFGDPETEVLLPRLESDLLEIMLACTDGTLDRLDVRWRDDAAVTVMLASGGYPGPYETGRPIDGLDDVDDDVIVFHAGTKREGERIVTAGGRVVAVTALGRSVADARAKAYDNVRRIRFDGMHYRTDIAAADTPIATAR